MPGVYLAESLVKLDNGSVITIILSTTEEEVELSDPVIKLEELGDSDTSEAEIMGVTEQGKDTGDQNLSIGERVMAKLREEHLNEEEKKLLREVCFEYQDVFYLPGDKLSCTNAARHTIQINRKRHLPFVNQDYHRGPYCQGFRRVACHPVNARHSGRQHSRRTEVIPDTTCDITYPIIGHPEEQ